MPTYTYSIIECAWAMLIAGFPPYAIPTGIAIMTAESSRRYEATLDTPAERSVGPWQINLKAHGQDISEDNARSLITATAYAYYLYKRADNDYTDWSTYTDGEYKHHLPLGSAPCVYAGDGIVSGLFREDWNLDIIGSISAGLIFYDHNGAQVYREDL